MKNLKLFFALFAMLALGVGNAWADVITLTTNSTTVGKGTPVEGKFDYKLTFSSTTDAGNAYVQNAKNSSIFNTVAIPGTITSIKLTDCATTSTKTDGSFKVYGGTSSGNGCTNEMANITGLSSTKTDKTIDFSGNYAYFKIVVGSARVLKISSIVITYTPTGGGVTPDPCTTPTVAWNTKPANGEVGGSMTASVTTNYSNGLTYSSSNQTVATITDAVFINYLSAGNTTITATVTGDGTTFCEGPVSVQQEITVTAPAGGGGDDDADTWTLVKNVNDLAAGDQVVIAASSDNYALSTTQNSNNRGRAAVTKNGETITFGNDVQVLTLQTGNVSNSFALYTGSGYLYAASSSKNYLRTETSLSNNSSWNIAITNAGVATITAQGTNTNNLLRYNSSSSIFSCYSSGQGDVSIYKKGGSGGGGSTPDPDPTYYTITLNPNYPEGKKGTFIDTVGNAVDGDLKISWLGETETTPIAKLYSSISLDGYIFEGWYEITAEGEKNRKNTGTITRDTTFYARWKVPYTVTFNAGTGKCDPQSITETTADGIKLPAATLTDCDDWTFLGWAEAAIASESTTPPASLAEGSTYKPTGNITLYAIYKRVEGGGEGTAATLTFDNTSKRTTLTTDQQVWEENDITLTNNKASSTSNIVDNSNPARFYKSSEIIISAPGAITKIVAKTSGSDYTTALVNSVEGGGATSDGNTVTITPTASSNTYTIQLTGGQVRLNSITVTYGGSPSTSYYYSNPVCGSTPTLTVNPTSLAFGNVTVNSNKEMTFTLTGSDLTANAALALSGTNESMFSVNPTSVTQSAGSIDQTITVTYAPTAAGNHTATLTISSTDAESKTVTLSGVGSNPPTWQPATINFEGIIQVECGSKTRLNAADPNGPATITFKGYDLQNSVTVTASEGFLVSTNKEKADTYEQEVTVNPHKDGQNIGKIQNVYVIADATAKTDDFTGTITLTGNDITNGSQVINVTAAVTCTQYTITWSVNGDDTQKTTFYAGDEWDLPEIPDFDCNGREFVGWTTSEISGETPNAPAELYKSKGDFPEINEDKTFYAVFATSSGDDSNETTVSVSIADYADNNNWVNSQNYSNINISSDITATVTGSNNTGKYYTNGEDWRLYQTETPTLTFNAANEYKILSITITYTSDKTGVLTFNGSNIASGTPCEINATSAEFGVGNTGSATNGQVRITSISVTYSGGGGGYSGYATNCNPCDNSNFIISESNFTISKDSILNLGALIQTENQSTIIYTCNTPNGTITDNGLFSATESGTYTVTIHQDSDSQDHCAVNKTITIKVVGEIVTLKWSVNGATNTNLSPGTVEKNTPIGTLPVPKTGCDDKTFMGWTTTSTVNNDGSDIEYIKATTTPTENTTYYAVFASKGTQNSDDLEEIFYESFDKINGQGGNDEQWNSTENPKVGAGTNAIDSLITNHSWNITKGYEAHQCVKMGASSTQGIITTPAINQLDGNAVLTFKAGAWDNDGEKLDIIVEVSGGATISPSAFTLKKAQFDTYTANITGGSSETKITIKAKDASKNRFFIDDIRIAAGAVSFEDYTTRCGTYTVTYHGFEGYSSICGDNPAEIVVEVGSTFTVATCTPEDPKALGRIFAGEWYTNPNGRGDTYKPGDSFVVEEDVVLYAKWTLNTNTTPLPVDDENKDLATTDVVVTGGTTLTIQAGTTTINSLTLKGGLQENGTYAMPVVNIPEGATLVRNNNKINLDLKVNNKSYYPFAVPFEVANTSENVNYLDTTLKKYANAVNGYGEYYRILEYNGALRAENGVNSKENWVHVGRTNVKLMPGKGYAISAVPASGQGTVTIRITMTVDNAWLANGEQESITVKEQTTTRNAVEVTAYTGEAAEEHQRHAGWNFVANPYLANFAGTNASGSFINGELLINKGDYSYSEDEVPYVTIPTYNFAHYYQVKLSEATLSPAYSFFVQVGTDGTMTFETAGRQAAPASIAARNAEERPVKMDVDITLSDNHSSDQTGIIISDRYNDTYEIGRDLEKLFGSAYNLSVYTLMADNTPLAFQALAIRSNMQVIPVGYRAPEQGEYTFRLNEATSSIDLLNEQYEQLVLVDYQTGELTNLLIADYTFYSERTQADNRFAIYAVPRQNAPTDLPNAIGQDKQAQKIIHNGHLYILRDGNVYNGNGQIVK